MSVDLPPSTHPACLPAHPPPPPLPQLTVTINGLYAETTERLEGALAAVCSDFRPSHYTKVLEGYMFLGNVEQVGAVSGCGCGVVWGRNMCVWM